MAKTDGAIVMRQQIEALRRLEKLPERSAPAVALALRAEILRNVSRGVGPDGEAWRPTQDGRKPLQNAGAHLSVRAVGTRVVARLDDHYARHHLGAVRGGEGLEPRRILPTGKIPAPVSKAIARVVTGEFNAIMKGKK